MTRPDVVLKQLRLETDRLVRERPFFARAVRGWLPPEEYSDLLSQLVGLTYGVGRAAGEELLGAASRDLDVLWRGHDLPRSAPCPAVCLFSDRWAAGPLPGDLALDVGLTVMGTSWSEEAARRLAARYPGATTFLGRLGRLGRQRLRPIEARLLGPDRPFQAHVVALAELTRGALLGLAAHLEGAWPAPTGALEGA